jgi:tetratricopeptide (TPR) repeat protein
MFDAPESADRIALLRALAAESPGDATTQFLLGRELASAGHADDAAAAFAAAIAADPDYAAAYRQLGNTLEAAERRDEAADAYRRGVAVAERTNDLQAGREMRAFLKRMERDAG